MSSNMYKIIELTNLLEATKNMSQAKDIKSIADALFDFIINLKQYDMAVIYRINEEYDYLDVVSCRGSDINNLKKRVQFKIGEGAVGWVAKEKKALLIENVLKSKKIRVRQFYDEDPIIRSFLAVPLVTNNKVKGIISISSSKEYQFNEQDAELITILASQCAALLELNNEITQAKRFSNSILENMNSGVMVINNKKTIISFNKAAEKITGYKLQEVIFKSFEKLHFKEKEENKYIIESFENEKEFFEQKSTIINKQGNYINIRLSTSLLRNSKGKIIACICIFRDNTEIEKLQQKIITSEKMAAVGRLTSGIIHEIRNPLLPIRTASEFLLNKIEKETNNDDIIKLIQIINDESERLNRFLDQLVDIFLNKQINSNKINHNEPIIKNIDEILVLIKHSLKKYSIKLNLEFLEEDFYVPLSKDELRQIFLNLFINSIDSLKKINKKDRIISINVFKEKNIVNINIEDNGIGIDNNKLNLIFDYFYTTKEKGTGLGLSIVHNIINKYNGEILVESEKNNGTVITINIPVAEEV